MLVVPLLIESGVYRSRVARVLVVDCDENTQIARVMARSGLTVEAVRAIMATQASRAERLAAGDDVVLNDGDRAQLAERIDVLHLRYLSLAAL
jgi:dephospho-CoA kinase